VQTKTVTIEHAEVAFVGYGIATGDAQALAIAKALKTLPTAPRRSVIILFVGAEEQGLLGSKYFAEHPPVGPGKVAANVNYDGGNIWGRTRDIVQIGKGKSSIDQVVARIAARQRRTVKLDQFPDRGAFYRSDQFSFAKIGVPALYLKTGTDFVGRRGRRVRCGAGRAARARSGCDARRGHPAED
jgi:Zn-dependent M28 family amino/carboxypeptidase